MGLLQALVLEALSGYIPGLDPDSLRVNLLRGRVHLNDVDLTPGHVITCMGFPFRLASGTIGLLGLNFPWASIYTAPVQLDVARVELHFREVAFPDSQTDVFEAFRNAHRRQKNRTLAESERPESAITRALHKFIPVLLDRFEANISDIKLYLHFASGEIATFTLDVFETTAAEPMRSLATPTNHADLSKTIAIKGVAFSIDLGGLPVFAVEDTNLSLQLDLGAGLFNADLLLPEPIRVHIASSLGRFLVALHGRVKTWTDARTHRRPDQPITENPRAWFQYAARVIRDRTGLASSNVTLSDLQAMIPMLIEYKRLHVRRLRKQEQLQSVEEERIAQIEDSLHPDMILLLRRRARSDVLAEEVSAFATKEWLTWALFDYRMSSERERLAAELRKSLSIADQPGHDEASLASASSSMQGETSNFSKAWSKATVSVIMKSFNVSIADDSGQLLFASLHSSSLRAQVDSSMQSYGISLSARELFVNDGNVPILYRGDLPRLPDAGPTSGHAEHFLDAKIQRAALDRETTFSIRLCRFSIVAFMNRITTYVQLLSFISDVQQLVAEVSQGASSPEPSSLTLPSSTSSTGVGETEMRAYTEVKVPEVEIFFNRELSPGGKTQNDGYIRLSLGSIAFRRLGTTGKELFQGTCNLVLDHCNGQSSSNNSSTIHPRRTSSPPSAHVSTSIRCEISSSKIAAFVEDMEGFVSVSGARDMMYLLTSAPSNVSLALDSKGGTEVYQACTRSGNGVVPAPCERELFVSKLKLKLSSSAEANDGLPANALFLNCSVMKCSLAHGHMISLSVLDMSLEEPVYGGAITFSPASRGSVGLRVEDLRRRNEGTNDFEVKCDEVSIRCGIGSLLIALRMVREFGRASFPFFDGAGSKEYRRELTRDRHHGVEVRVSLLMRKACFEAFSESNRVMLMCQNIFVVSHEAVLSGSLDGLQFQDLSGFSGDHKVAIKFTPPSSSTREERRALTFNHSPTCTNLHLFALHFTVLRSFVDRLVGLFKTFSAQITNILCDPSSERNGARSIRLHESQSAPQHSISVQGSDLVIRLPLNSYEEAGVRLIAPYVTVTHTRGALTVSARKLSVLTRTETNASMRRVDNPLCDNSHPPGWAVLVRALDLDCSNSFKSNLLSSELRTHNKSQWNLQVWSKAGFFATPSQLRMLRRLALALESSISMEASTQGRTPRVDEESRQTPNMPVGSGYEHWCLSIETHMISVELLEEDHDGLVLSTIAYIELGPIDFSLRRAREETKLGHAADVTRWSAASQFFRLDDGSLESPDNLREVIRKRDEVLESPAGTKRLLQTRPLLSAKCVSRNDGSAPSGSSLEVKLEGLRIIVGSRFILRLVNFFRQAALTQMEDLSAGKHVANGATSESSVDQPVSQSDESSSSQQQQVRNRNVAALKASVNLTSSVVQLIGRGRRLQESSVFIDVEALKTVILSSKEGFLLPGSQIRLTEGRIGMVYSPNPMVLAERRPHSTMAGNQGNADYDQQWGGTKGVEIKLQNPPVSSVQVVPTVPGERLVWSVFRQKRTGRTGNTVAIRGATLKLPVHGTGRFACMVRSVALDVSVGWLLNFAYLLLRLDIFPLLEGETAVSVPPIYLSVNNLSARVRVPVVRSDLVSDASSRPETTLRVRLAMKVVIGKDIAGITGNVKVSADAIDERRGIRDQILSPSALKVETVFAKNVSVSIDAPLLLRFSLSPLTVRTLTGLALSVSSTFASQTDHSKSNFQRSDTRASSSAYFLQGLSFSASFRGVALYCIAEVPRVQLMRLSLRELAIRFFIPPHHHGNGKLELSLQDVVLEDTISWRFEGDGRVHQDSVEWTTLFAGSHEEFNDAISTRSGSAYRYLVGFHNSSLPSAESSQNDLARSHIFSSSLSWRYPLNHVTGRVKMKGFRFNANMSVVPHLKAWAQSIQKSISEVQDGYEVDSLPASDSVSAVGTSTSGPYIGVDHIEIDPFHLALSAKAPARHLDAAFSRRVLMWLLGSESSVGTVLCLPRVLLNGDFQSVGKVANRIRSIYVSALASQQLARQLFWQAPRISRLVRVFAMSLLRSRPTLIGRISEQPVSLPSHRSLVVAGRHSLGLQEALQRLPPGICMHVRDLSITSHSAAGSASVSAVQGEGTDYLIPEHGPEAGHVETLDLTNDSTPHGENFPLANGKVLFMWLRRNDDRVPKNDRFEFYAPYNTNEAVLVTSSYLLFATQPTRSIQEPLIPRASIIEYHLTGPRITIVCARLVNTPTARRAARHQSRDTFSLASHVGERRRVAEIFMHEIECSSPQYATWLRSQLPGPHKDLQNVP